MDVPHEVQARAPRPGDRPTTRGPSSRQRLRRELATPGAARRAIVLGEVLGRPLSLRIDTENHA